MICVLDHFKVEEETTDPFPEGEKVNLIVHLEGRAGPLSTELQWVQLQSKYLSISTGQEYSLLLSSFVPEGFPDLFCFDADVVGYAIQNEAKLMKHVHVSV